VTARRTTIKAVVGRGRAIILVIIVIVVEGQGGGGETRTVRISIQRRAAAAVAVDPGRAIDDNGATRGTTMVVFGRMFHIKVRQKVNMQFLCDSNPKAP
jgi:hypothetical protein